MGIFIPDTFVFKSDGTVSHVLQYNSVTQRIDSVMWAADGDDPNERRTEQRRRVLEHLLLKYDASSDIVAVLQKPVRSSAPEQQTGAPRTTTVDYLDVSRLSQFLSLPHAGGNNNSSGGGEVYDQTCLISQFVHPKEENFSLVYCVFQGSRVVATEWRVCRNKLADASIPVRERTSTTAAPSLVTSTGEMKTLSKTRPMIPGSEKRLSAVCSSLAQGFGKGWNRDSSRLALYFIPVRNPGLAGVAKYYLLAATEAPIGQGPIPAGFCAEDVSWTREAHSETGPESMGAVDLHKSVKDPRRWTFTRKHEKKHERIDPLRSDPLRRPTPSASRARSDREVAEEDGKLPWQSYQRAAFDMPQQPPSDVRKKDGLHTDGEEEGVEMPVLTMEDYVIGLRNGSATGYLVAPPFIGRVLDCKVPLQDVCAELDVLCGGRRKSQPVEIAGVDRRHAVRPSEQFKSCDSTKILREYETVLSESSKIMFSEAKEWEARRLHTSLIPADDDEFGQLRREMEPFVPAVRRSFLDKLFAERTQPPVEEVSELNKSELAQSIRKKEMAQLAAIFQRYADSPQQSGGLAQQMSLSGGVLSPIRADYQEDFSADSVLALVEALYTKIQDMIYEIYASETITIAPGGGPPQQAQTLAAQSIRDLEELEAHEVKAWLILNNVPASVESQLPIIRQEAAAAEEQKQKTPLVSVTLKLPVKYAAVGLLKSRIQEQFEMFTSFASSSLTTNDEVNAFRRAVRRSQSKSAIFALAVACKITTASELDM